MTKKSNLTIESTTGRKKDNQIIVKLGSTKDFKKVLRALYTGKLFGADISEELSNGKYICVNEYGYVRRNEDVIVYLSPQDSININLFEYTVKSLSKKLGIDMSSNQVKTGQVVSKYHNVPTKSSNCYAAWFTIEREKALEVL